MNVQFPRLLRPLWGKAVWLMNPSEKVIYLTFDDGPVPEVTPFVLDLLDRFQLKATFFCVGENVQKYPEVYAEVLRRGHKTGNHTYNHIKGFEYSVADYVDNAHKASNLIHSDLFRPPHGRITFKQMKALQTNYKIVMWDLITHDYNRRLSPETILRTVKKYSRNGSIVVFHDSIKAKDNMLKVLPQAIEYWLSTGYGFGVL